MIDRHTPPARASDLTRRNFLRWLGSGVIASAGLAGVFNSGLIDPHSLSPLRAPTPFGPWQLLEKLNYSDFSQQVGKTFYQHDRGIEVGVLRLVEVQDLRPKQRGSKETFILIFEGAASSALQGTYILANKALGHFPLFMVPAPSPSGISRYEVIFNRM
ncbi:MAG: hypothetical protein GY759_00335 [Chloroflexi bacterium]|nr:hypothetical protein [Chloroflexota bacterium]